MLPVTEEDLSDLVTDHTILMYDSTRRDSDYITKIIGHSATHIATKKENKTLPTELWLEIIAWLDELNANHNEYYLIYPVEMSSVQIDGGESEPALVCNIVQEWIPFGKIRNGHQKYYYQTWLESPLTEFEEDDEPDKDYEDDTDDEENGFPQNPFDISTTVLPDNSITIPVSHLNSDLPFLYHDIEVAEVISWVEGGDCRLCGGRDRVFCAGCGGCRVLNKFDYGDRDGGDCALRMLCPLCVGVEYAQKSFIYDPYDDSDEKTSRSYIEWFSNRMEELGYTW